MKKIFCLMIALTLIFPVLIGLLYHKSPIAMSTNKFTKKITYLETKTSKVRECDLEEYLVGVLAAEMPAEYHVEALKAQAVAARSFIASRVNQQNPDHLGAVVCDNASHCKAHLDRKAAMEKWPEEKAEIYWEKLEGAVAETEGEYMTCGEDVVEAFFFARSNGRTENSEDVWGEERPYLKSVESSGDKSHPEFETVVELTTADVRNKLKSLNSKVKTGDDSLKIGKITYTAGGSVATIELDGMLFRGKDIRLAFDLKSASFSVNQENGKMQFKVLGYGHGVGMSQFGANCMAENGKNYTEILSHYYTNIQIIKF